MADLRVLDLMRSITVCMMFEGKLSPPAIPVPCGKGVALRAMCWEELSARLSAASELRHMLRQDSHNSVGSFGDAASGYFAAIEHSKPDVNQNALSAGKSDPCIEATDGDDTSKGDRE